MTEKLNLGSLELYIIDSGNIRLDGGAMFGTVPRVLWEKTNPPDERNRILIGLNLLLIKTAKNNILIDTGTGDKGNDKFKDIYAIEHKPIDKELARAGIGPSEIDIVINTHLHFDHAGGNTVMGKDGRYIPAFPNARYIIQKDEWSDAINTNERTRASYRADDFLPLQEASVVELIEGDTVIEKGIIVLKTSGHNRNHQCVLIESENKKAVYLGDLVPTASHIPLPYIMGYDLFPLETLENKKSILNKAADEGWLLIFEHDPKIKTGYLKRDGGKFVLKTL